jgi:hypothetical protein
MTADREPQNRAIILRVARQLGERIPLENQRDHDLEFDCIGAKPKSPK